MSRPALAVEVVFEAEAVLVVEAVAEVVVKNHHSQCLIFHLFSLSVFRQTIFPLLHGHFLLIQFLFEMYSTTLAPDNLNLLLNLDCLDLSH